jgi:hypothetical protein
MNIKSGTICAAVFSALLVSCAAPEKSPVPAPASTAGRCAADPGRFTVRDDVTYDARTRLTWRRCPAGQVFNRGSSRCDGGIYATDKLGSARLAAESERKRSNAGWRLPTIEEITAISDKACKPVFNRTAFPEYSGAPVWTSTAAGPGKVYQLDPATGNRTVESEVDAPAIVILVRD